ncbi:MAG: T9SS type A sorting domain-containing protein [bacterium]
MKNFILLPIVFLLFCNIILAQGIEETFTAKAAITEVMSKAKSEGIGDPVLVGLGLAAGEYVIPGIGTLNPELDLTNGQSSIWLYMVAEKTDITKTINIGVIKFFTGFIPMKIDIDISSIPISYIDPIVVDWMDTDILCQKLNSNTMFSDFVKDNQAIFDFVTLDYEDSAELDGMGNLEQGTYWLLSCSKDNGESIICYTDAVSGATTCFNTTGVDDETSENSFNISPNPATDKLIIEKQNVSVITPNQVFIVDSKGYIIEKYNLEGTTINTINIQNLPNGTYTLIIGNSSKRFVKVN